MPLSKKMIKFKKNKRKVRSNKGKKRGSYKNRKKTSNICLIMDLDGNYHEIDSYPGDDFIYTHLMENRHIPIEYFKENEPQIFQNTYNNYLNFCRI